MAKTDKRLIRGYLRPDSARKEAAKLRIASNVMTLSTSPTARDALRDLQKKDETSHFKSSFSTAIYDISAPPLHYEPPVPLTENRTYVTLHNEHMRNMVFTMLHCPSKLFRVIDAAHPNASVEYVLSASSLARDVRIPLAIARYEFASKAWMFDKKSTMFEFRNRKYLQKNTPLDQIETFTQMTIEATHCFRRSRVSSAVGDASVGSDAVRKSMRTDLNPPLESEDTAVAGSGRLCRIH